MDADKIMRMTTSRGGHAGDRAVRAGAIYRLRVALPLPEAGVRYPRCTGGARACAPEDCGGIGGYQNFVKAISKPRHPDHAEMLEWIGGEWDPEAFDMDAVNARLQSLKRRPARRPKK